MKYFKSSRTASLLLYTLKSILRKFEFSDQLISWMIVLSKYNITFQLHTAFKSQVFIDFIKHVRYFNSYQHLAEVSYLPPKQLNPILSSWLFMKWGMNFKGKLPPTPLPMSPIARGQRNPSSFASYLFHITRSSHSNLSFLSCFFLWPRSELSIERPILCHKPLSLFSLLQLTMQPLHGSITVGST